MKDADMQHSSDSGATDITWVSSTESLQRLISHLSRCKAFAFDTEFDSFRRTYGFTLLLIQICDGERTWIIDPLRIKHLDPLWPLFGNPRIRKIGYALGEDIRLLKSFDCHPLNVWDIQIARRLCGKSEAGLAKALEEDLGVVLDKSHQRSDWARRPLSATQVEYLANDVVHLFDLMEMNRLFERDAYLASVFEEEMQMQTEIVFVENTVQLSRAQEKKYDEVCKNALLGLLVARDAIARELNVPVNFIAQNELIEEVLAHRDAFLASPFIKGFHPKVRSSERFSRLFLDAVRACPEHCEEVRVESTLTREERIALREARLDREEAIIRDVFLPLEARLLRRFDVEIVRFLLRGVRKTITAAEPDYEAMRPYQRRLVEGHDNP